jgi:nitrate reductase gamma subunit
VVLRVLGEVLLFRSLFRNKKAELHDGQKLTYGSSKWLWFAGLLFHWSMLIIVLRHTKFFFVTEPAFATFLDHADRFFEITLPAFFATDALILVGLSILFIRRLWDTKLRFISLQTDFFPLFLLLGIVLVGISMRYIAKVNVMPVHDQMIAMMDGNFSVMGDIDPLFYIHLFLVSVLVAYFPFSKLMHMGAIFLSPTRNLGNTSRVKRHVNPWNPEMKIRTYAEYEDDYREKMKKAGLPVEKQ